MVEQHSKDYKLTAVKYYLTHNKTMRNVCNKIFNCKIQSLSRWKIKKMVILREKIDNIKILKLHQK